MVGGASCSHGGEDKRQKLRDIAPIKGTNMRTVEITYRYGEPDSPTRSRPTDAGAARHCLEEGSHAFAALLDGLADCTGF
jgi:hypothetical protein